jgi:hypothetical protein
VFISLLTLLLFRSCLLLPFGIIRRFLPFCILAFLFSCLQLMHAMSLLLVPVGVVACSCFISYYPCHILYVILCVFRIFDFIYIYACICSYAYALCVDYSSQLLFTIAASNKLYLVILLLPCHHYLFYATISKITIFSIYD